MKIKKIKNVENFLHTINDCSGEVFLVTSEGDRLNLKSKLTQYVALSKMFDTETDLGEMEIYASKEDIFKIMEFLVGE